VVTITTLLCQANTQRVVRISEEQLSILFEHTKIVFKQETGLRGVLRILQYRTETFVQESTDKNELVFRRMASLDAARSFVEQRLQSYERMWDGLGVPNRLLRVKGCPAVDEPPNHQAL